MAENVQEKLHEAERCLQIGNPAKCLELCSEVLTVEPQNTIARYLRGIAHHELLDFDTSIRDLEAVANANPDNDGAAFFLGRALNRAERFEEAQPLLERTLSHEQFGFGARYELAFLYSNLRRKDEAFALYKQMIAIKPDHAPTAAKLAGHYEQANDLSSAEQWMSHALNIDPKNRPAKLVKATLLRRGGQYKEATELFQTLEAEAPDSKVRIQAGYGLGKSYDAVEEWDKAFDSMTRSNQLQIEALKSPASEEDTIHSFKGIASLRQWLNENPFDEWVSDTQEAQPRVAFLVGFPRSGTTLLHSILSAHPDVEVIEETNLFMGLHRDWHQIENLRALSQESSDSVANARRIFMANALRAGASGDRALMIDKQPLNLTSAFLIHRIFPEAPIIFALRHPLDSCLNCFFQNFSLHDNISMQYFLDLTSTARYYDRVMDLGTLALKQVSNPVHRIHYEHVVGDFETEIRGLVKFLDLDWDDRLLKYYEVNKGQRFNTPSYEMVAKPISSRAVGRWQNYADKLEPIVPVLNPWIKRFGYAND